MICQSELTTNFFAAILASDDRPELSLPIDAFSEKTEIELYKLILSVIHDGQVPNLVNVTTKLFVTAEAKAVISPIDLAELANKSATGANLAYFQTMLWKNYQQQRFESLGRTIAGRQLDDIPQIIDDLQAVRMIGAKESFTTIGHAMSETLKAIEQKMIGKNDDTLKTGWPNFDRLTGGLAPGQLISVAARTGVGKSITILQWALNIAKSGAPVAIVSTEMTDAQLSQRLLAMLSGIELWKARSGRLDQQEFNQLMDATEQTENLQIYLLPPSTNNIANIEIALRDLHKKNHIEVAFVDYVQMIKASGKYQNKTYEIDEIVNRLKFLALELKIPIIQAVQLNRDSMGGSPDVSNAKDSDSIGLTSDLFVIIGERNILRKPEIETIDKEYILPHVDNQRFWAIRKGRDTGMGVSPLYFDGAIVSLRELEKRRAQF